MLAFRNTEVSKPQIIAQLKAHAEADEIIKGRYWAGGRGCAIGCTVHGSDHSLYEPRFGIPQMLAKLEDLIFEGLPNGAAKAWPLRFMRAVKPGSDLSLVGWEFLHWLQTENLKCAEEHEMPADVIGAIRQCIEVLVSLTKGEPFDIVAAQSAVEAASTTEAGSAARAATRAVASAWITETGAEAESAAWSAGSAARVARLAWSAESAAMAAVESAAWAAVEAAAWSAGSAARAAVAVWLAVSGAGAREAAYIKMADKLIDLIKNAATKSK